MQNKTRVDKYALKQLIKVINKKQRIILGILGIAFMVWGFFHLYIDNIYSIVIIAGFLFFCFFVFIFEKIIIMQERNSKIFKAVTYYMFDFHDLDFEVNTVCNEDLYSYSKHEYLDIYKIIENKNYLFIFISTVEAYILSKHVVTYKELEAIKLKLKSEVKKYKEI